MLNCKIGKWDMTIMGYMMMMTMTTMMIEMMMMIILMTMIISQSLQLHHQQFDLQDNDQVAFHLQRLQVVPQFGLTAFEDPEDFNRC
jgi:hypothetical protein